MNLRLQLYGFRAALLEDPKADPELALLAAGLALKVEVKPGRYPAGISPPTSLIIEAREHNTTLQAIKDAI